MQGIKGMRGIVYLAVLALAGCSYGADVPKADEKIQDLVKLSPAWKGEIIAKVDQSFAGWSVAIGDADNDGKNEILTTGSPDSRLEFYKKVNGKWQWKTLAKNLAEETPGMGLTVQIVDLNGDGVNEIILGTGQDAKLTCAKFYILQTNGSEITKKISSASFLNGSAYTHNFGVYDIDGDGIKEVLTAYCGSGEVTRYDVNKELTAIERRHLTTHPGSGEDAMIADVDNDGKMEFITCDSFRKDAAKVKIFEFDENGELVMPARVVLAGYDGKPCFHCNVEVGDVDNDGKNELIVCWKRQELPNQGTILAYTISASGVAAPKYTFLHEDPNLDLSYCERQMIVADADNDGKNDLVVTTRGEKEWGGRGLGNVFLFKIEKGKVQKTLLADFCDGRADSLWPAVGDADNDGKNEIVIATGAGSRRKPGSSYVVMIKKKIENESVADVNTYLKEIKEELQRQWPNNRTVNIVCHGHSVPAGYFKTPIVDTFNAYPHLLHQSLKQKYPHAVVNVIVTAIGGENSESGARRFDEDVLIHKPDVLLIDYGLNDRKIGLERAKAAWTVMIEKAKQENIKIILLTPTADTSANMNDPNDPLNLHAQQIRQLAKQYGVALVDSLAEFNEYVAKGGRLDDLMSQSNHPNRKGHELVVKALGLWF